MAKALPKSIVIAADLPGNHGESRPGLRKQVQWSGEKWEPGMLPTGVLRTKVRHDPAPYGQSSQVEIPKARSPRKA